MRNTTPLENTSQLGSSNGFNRKLKLASQRPGSRDQKHKIGEIFPSFQDPLAQNPYNLELFNLYQDELTFGSTMKSELLQIQEEINQLDLDGKIRNIDPKQEYRLQNVKKWVSQHSNIQSKQLIENKFNQNIDVNRLIEALNTKSSEDALIKLYKFITIMDCIISKVTEYEAIFTIKFDETYTQMCQRLRQESPQVQVNKFTLAFTNLERCSDFIQTASKLNQKLLESKGQELVKTVPSNDLDTQIKKLIQDNQQLQKVIKFKDQQLSELEKRIAQNQMLISDYDNRLNSKDDSQTIISQLQQQIKQLQQQLQQSSDAKPNLQAEQNKPQGNAKTEEQLRQYQLEIQKKDLQITQLNATLSEANQTIIKLKQDILNQKENSNNPANKNKGPEYFQKVIDQIASDYKEQQNKQNQENTRLKAKITEQEIMLDNQKSLEKSLRDQIEQLITVKNEIYDKFQRKHTTKEEFANSYEAALKLEFDIMKKTFENRISTLQSEQDQTRKDHFRTLNEVRIQLEREQETKKLLMSKLNLYV